MYIMLRDYLLSGEDVEDDAWLEQMARDALAMLLRLNAAWAKRGRFLMHVRNIVLVAAALLVLT